MRRADQRVLKGGVRGKASQSVVAELVVVIDLVGAFDRADRAWVRCGERRQQAQLTGDVTAVDEHVEMDAAAASAP